MRFNGQSADINQGVDRADGVIGAGDQGLMFGYACDETPELMPDPIVFAHRLVRRQAEPRRSGALGWLGPDVQQGRLPGRAARYHRRMKQRTDLRRRRALGASVGASLGAALARAGSSPAIALLAGQSPAPAGAATAEPARRPGLLVVNASAGTSPDLLARRLASQFTRTSESGFIVENLQGGGGMLAARRVLGRPADGTTILLANSGLVCNPPPASPGSPELDPVTDLAPIAILCSVPFFLVAHPGLGVRRLQDLGNLPRSSSVMYAISTVGSAGHIAGEMLFERAGLPRTAVPYSKNAQAIVDVAAGNVGFGIFSWLSVAGAIETGAVVPVAVCSRERVRFVREIPTAHEQGFPGFHLEGWQGLFVASRTPTPAQREIEARVEGAFARGTMTETLTTAGYGDLFMRSAQARGFVSTEIDRYRALMKIHRIA